MAISLPRSLKRLARDWLPPILLDAYRGSRRKVTVGTGEDAGALGGYVGDFPDWRAARAVSTGYDGAEILRRVSAALLKVKNGEAVYERDSVLFSEPQYSWPVATALLWAAAINGGRLTVIDYGGSLGSSYYQNRPFLSALSGVRWNIVEQRAYVELGQELFQDEKLRFHHSIASCLREGAPQLVLFSSVLQYIEEPHNALEEAASSGAEFIVVDRTIFHGGAQDKIAVQTVPSDVFEARLPVWLFSETALTSALESRYRMFCRFDSYLSTAALDREQRGLQELGFIFVRRGSGMEARLQSVLPNENTAGK